MTDADAPVSDRRDNRELLARFDALEGRIGRLEDRIDEQGHRVNIIGKTGATVAVQLQNTARALERLAAEVEKQRLAFDPDEKIAEDQAAKALDAAWQRWSARAKATGPLVRLVAWLFAVVFLIGYSIRNGMWHHLPPFPK